MNLRRDVWYVSNNENMADGWYYATVCYGPYGPCATREEAEDRLAELRIR